MGRGEERSNCQDIYLNLGEHELATCFASSKQLASLCTHFPSVTCEQWTLPLSQRAVRDACKIEEYLDAMFYQGKKQLSKTLKNRMLD